MRLLNESYIELDPQTRQFYTFYDDVNGGMAKISVDSMRKQDDTDFVYRCLKKRDFATQFAYFNGIGDAMYKLRSAVRSNLPKEIEKARVEFISHASQYIMNRQFPMVIEDNGRTVVVKGDFRLSSHTVNPKEWKSNGHHDFGISVVFDNNRTEKIQMNGDKSARMEIWEYCVTNADAEKVLELYKYVWSGRPVTKHECDKIMGMSPEPITDGRQDIDAEFNTVPEKKPYIPPKFTLDDVANTTEKWTDPNSGKVYPMIVRGEQRFAVDEDEFCVYLIKKNGRLSTANRFEITEGVRRRRTVHLTESDLRAMIHEAIRQTLFG